jgi:hypothetical protein
MECPRCGGIEFAQVDCGPDSYDDDIFYISDVCKKCGLWHDGWDDKWYANVESWREVEDADEWQSEPAA